MADVYVYYRIADGMAGRAETQVDALIASVRPRCGVARRARRRNDPTTWMEVYEGVDDPDDFVAALEAAARAFDCAIFTCGTRHVECFERAAGNG